MSGRLVHELLHAAAERHGERPAVVDRARRLGYGELAERSSRLAHALRDAGVERGDRVGLLIDKSLEALVGIYGVLGAGAAYVPLDTQSPPARLAYIVRDAGLGVLVTSGSKAGLWDELVREGAPLETLVVLDGVAGEAPPALKVVSAAALAHHPAERPDVGRLSEGDLAYILYTSGSTGAPKGVALSHLNARAFVDWAAEQFAISPRDRLSNHAPLQFDLSTFDLFAAARGGAAVVLVPPELTLFPIEVARWIGEQEITVWYSVPSALTLLVLRGKLSAGDLPRLRAVLFAGEVFPTKHLARLMELLPQAGFFNLYGPTETNVCTWYEVPALPEPPPTAIPIGDAITGVEVLAVDGEGRRVANGEVGELCVHGPTVMRGYWGDPAATARGLAPMPAAGLEDVPVYRTGDLVVRGVDGNYSFLGRRDAQVKRRGYRIELGEIESALNAHPAVVECAVTAAADELHSSRIVAHLVVRERVGEPDLAAACLERVPRYALPDAFEVREDLPRTTTGKIDRRALAAAGGGG